MSYTKNFEVTLQQTDAEYYSKIQEHQLFNMNQSDMYFFDNDVVEAASCPRKYFQIIERMVNTLTSSKSKSLTFITGERGGRGNIFSQAGEIMTLISCTLTNSDSDKFFDSIETRVNHLKSIGKTSIVNNAWISSAKRNRYAIHTDLSMMYGDSYKIVGAAWNIAEDLKIIGFDGNHKGSFADIVLKIRANNSVVYRKISLKQALLIDKTKLLTMSPKKYFDWDSSLPMDFHQETYLELLTGKLLDWAYENKKTIAKEFSSGQMNMLSTVMSDKSLLLNDFLESIDEHSNSTTRAIRKCIIHSMEDMSKKYPATSDLLNTLKSESKSFSKELSTLIQTNKKLKNGFLRDLNTAFPLKSVYNGDEVIIFGKYLCNLPLIKSIFLVDSYEEFHEKLKVHTAKNGASYLTFFGSKNIDIAKIRIYEHGTCYGGIFRFDVNISSGFVKEIKRVSNEAFLVGGNRKYLV